MGGVGVGCGGPDGGADVTHFTWGRATSIDGKVRARSRSFGCSHQFVQSSSSPSDSTRQRSELSWSNSTKLFHAGSYFLGEGEGRNVSSCLLPWVSSDAAVLLRRTTAMADTRTCEMLIRRASAMGSNRCRLHNREIGWGEGRWVGGEVGGAGGCIILWRTTKRARKLPRTVTAGKRFWRWRHRRTIPPKVLMLPTVRLRPGKWVVTGACTSSWVALEASKTRFDGVPLRQPIWSAYGVQTEREFLRKGVGTQYVRVSRYYTEIGCR